MLTTDHTTIRAVLARACARVGLDDSGARVVRCVNNAVYRLERHPIIVRITLTPGLRRRALAAVEAARLLDRHRVPVVQPAHGVPQIVHVEEHVVTFWLRAADTGRTPTASELARLLRRLHRVPPAGAALPRWDPVTDLRTRIHDARTRGWPEADLDLLARRCDAVEKALSKIRYQLPEGVIHGDAQVGNLIATPGGVIWCDLDTACIGPREWDLVPVAVRQLRFQHRTDQQSQLADAYGFDVTRWPGFAVLRELRELKLAAVGLPIARDARSRIELRRRLHSIRTGDTTTRWTPYH
ncbi:phosphotransferase family protein [Kutzneria kofuensis]|uniref:Aminoglycoside phosphotransferase (APT) family kinase protein n=1 Tax=Kutzneria kofuensis TaxID=103725 RepID=A0A7W9KLS5_9PSEU|nr:phosphotransferase [Kutzneria kofuensis]MBB5894932.1 aminoglycoside phosphotransferase (APT) family kinase protein [Kutzneria kofuensis]